MAAFLSLLKKECRQNILIYLLPGLLLAIVWLIRQQAGGISLQLARILVFTVPIALAGSYGLQAFDLEESGQTRDFLITRPLSLARIIAAKYLSGLIFLLPLTYLWHLTLVPQRVVWPHFIDLKQFWFIFYLIFVVIIYSGSFITGALVKGPKKLLFAILGSGLLLVWFACSWFELLTLAYLNIPESWPELLVQALLILATLGLLFFLNSFLYQLLYRYLRNLPLIQPHSNQRNFWAALVLIPVLFYGLNLITRPLITPFESLAKTFLTDEDWFIAVNGAAHDETHYLWADLEGRLAVGASHKPRLVYSGLPGLRKPLTNLGWPPNGNAASFTENRQIKAYSLVTKKVVPVLPGDISFWSDYKWEMLIAQELGQVTKDYEGMTIDFKRYRLTRINLNNGNYSSLRNELVLPTGSLAWNASTGKLIVVTNYWLVLTSNFTTGQIDELPLDPPRAVPTRIVATIITPLTTSANKQVSYRIAIFSQTKGFAKSQRYDISFYDYNPVTNRLQPIALLKRIRLAHYKDLVICNTPAPKILVSKRRGVYRQLILPEEATR